jgi:hypothetical protein
VNATETLLQIHDLDLLLAEARDRAQVSRYRRAGIVMADSVPLDAARLRLLEALDARWRYHYERALARYGNGISGVRARVCQGCFMTLPRSASPGEAPALLLCESCGRVLLWEPRVPA